MEMKIDWIDDAAALADATARIGAGPLCVDTEGDSLHHYPEKTCLIQISFGGRNLLVDPFADVDLGVLAGPLRDRGLRKIFHAADYDLRVLHRDHGFEVRGLFDTMLAARLVGERAFGLAALLEQHLGVRLDKRFQRADWSQRPIPDAMRRYAAMDTHYLEPLAGILEQRLRALGREAWAEEEFRRRENVRWEPSGSAEAYLRVKGSSRLGPRQLGVLRALHRMRERIAIERDRPPFKVFSNGAMLALATRLPRNRDALERIPEVRGPWSRGAAAAGLIEAIESGMALSESELPQPHRRTRRRRSGSFEDQVRELGKCRDKVATDLDIESSVLAPRGILEEAVDRREKGLTIEDIPELRRWQFELLRPLLE